MTAVSRLYGNNWGFRANQFLEGSRSLEDSPPSKLISSMEQQNNQGFYSALVSVVQAGVEKSSLDNQKVLEWLSKITDSHPEVIDELKVAGLIKRIISRINEIKQIERSTRIVTLLADVICELEKENLFGKANRKMTLLFMNYITSYFGSPIIVFKSEEKIDYLDAVTNLMKMRLLLAKKVRETVFIQGILMEKIGGKYGSDKYASHDPVQKEAIVEWNDLMRAEMEWKSQSTPNPNILK